MLLAILGVIVLTGDRLTVDGGQAEGNALALLSAVLFGTYLLAIGRLSLRLPAAPIMLWVSVVSTLVLLAASLASGESLLPATARGWSVLLLLAIVSYALGQGLLAVALARLGAAFSAVSLLFLPVIAALLGWLVLGEALTPHQAVGGAIVLASILGARRARR
jgi:drug/metabolite transporter (DMT)-like permease